MKLIFKKGTDRFYMRKSSQGTTITVNVSDLKKLWRVKLNENEILQLFRSQNPLVQSKAEWIITYVNTCLNSADHVSLDFNGSQLIVEMVKPSTEINVKLKFTLELQDSEQFFREITSPMVGIINQLVEQRSKLLSLVKSKDLELAEYKLEGANISRKNVETEELVEKEFLNGCVTEFVDRIKINPITPDLDLPQDLTEVYSEIAKIHNVKNSSDEIPAESAQVKNSNSSSQKAELKRNLGSSVIVQVPRAKQRKKNFNL